MSFIPDEDESMKELSHEQRLTEDRRRGNRRRAIQATLPAHPIASTKRLWDARDVATFLKASRNWVYLQAELGKIPYVRLGGLLRFDPEKIKALANGELPAVSPAKLK
jgi:hypothetical protein